MVTTIQEACVALFDQYDAITFLTDEEKKAFFVSLNKIAFWAHDRAEKTIDNLIEEVEKL